MTDRREFLGAMMAIFCGTLLPEPVRATIRLATDDEVVVFSWDDDYRAIWSKVPEGRDAWYAYGRLYSGLPDKPPIVSRGVKRQIDAAIRRTFAHA